MSDSKEQACCAELDTVREKDGLSNVTRIVAVNELYVDDMGVARSRLHFVFQLRKDMEVKP
jgi:hypothetical protein